MHLTQKRKDYRRKGKHLLLLFLCVNLDLITICSFVCLFCFCLFIYLFVCFCIAFCFLFSLFVCEELLFVWFKRMCTHTQVSFCVNVALPLFAV